VKAVMPRADRVYDDEVTLHQLADAIVEPAGIDAEWLRTLRDRMPPQYQSLLVAAIIAATALPERLPCNDSRCGAPPSDISRPAGLR